MTPSRHFPLNRWLTFSFIAAFNASTSTTQTLAADLRPDGYHAFPGDDLQSVVDRAATNSTLKSVFLHEGVYRPAKPSQALVYLNRRHNGVRLQGIGRPTLTAANPDIADRQSPAFPAIVNHLIYIGDRVSTNTIIEGLRLTGANHFVTNSMQETMEPDYSIRKGRFYYGDGGAIKVYHRSYPVLRDLEIIDNYASPCAGGVSIQHEGATNQYVLIQDCVFRNNRAEVTGAALDLLWGSHARVINCLFTGNVSNTGPGEGENPFNNNGAVTVFPRSILHLERCTLTGNRNGVDDQGGLSTYDRSIVAGNTLAGGPAETKRYELDLQQGGRVTQCVLSGAVLDPKGVVDTTANRILQEPVRFDAHHVPTGERFPGIGYRPPPRP